MGGWIECLLYHNLSAASENICLFTQLEMFLHFVILEFTLCLFVENLWKTKNFPHKTNLYFPAIPIQTVSWCFVCFHFIHEILKWENEIINLLQTKKMRLRNRFWVKYTANFSSLYFIVTWHSFLCQQFYAHYVSSFLLFIRWTRLTQVD